MFLSTTPNFSGDWCQDELMNSVTQSDQFPLLVRWFAQTPFHNGYRACGAQ